VSVSVSVTISAELRGLLSSLRTLDLEDAVGETALDAEAFAKRSFEQTPKAGRAYRRGKSVHVASAGGSFPAIDTGELSRATKAKRVSAGRWELRFGKTYSIYLEYGTRHMAARPFVRPTMDYAEERLDKAVRDALRRAGL
jgi:HK97 gp10 family phage protein